MNDRLTEPEARAWRVFVSATTRLLERLEHELQQRSGLSLTDFEILSMLSEAPSLRLRMSELAELVLVSRSRLTYRVDRLASLGYVIREECEDDRRGLFAILTDTGAEILAETAPGHTADIRTWLLAQLEGDDLYTFTEMLTRVDARLTTR